MGPSAPGGRAPGLLAYREGMSELLPGDPLRTAANIVTGAVDRVVDLVRGDDRPPPPTAGSVDLARYAGRWYELARLPMTFQDDATVSIAEYTLRDDGSVGVHNESHRGDELEHSIDGSATPAEGAEESNDRLRVRFGGLVRFVPVSSEGNYWVMRLADDYSTALVGTPDRSALWMLARDEHAWGSPAVEAHLAWAEEQGFDLDPLLVADWTTRTTHPYRPTA